MSSRYFRFQQNDGRGFGILRLDAIGDSRATIMDAGLSEVDAEARLAVYRLEERAPTAAIPTTKGSTT